MPPQWTCTSLRKNPIESSQKAFNAALRRPVSADAREPADREHRKERRDAGKDSDVNDRFALTRQER